MAMIGNDLIQTNNRILALIKKEEDDKAAERLYNFWIGAAQYREAIKFIQKSLEKKDVKEFMGLLRKEAQDLFIKIRESYAPWNGSFVERVAKPIRDDLFHYPNVSDQRWQDALDELARKRGSVFVEGTTIFDVNSEFADEIRSLLLSKPLGGPDLDAIEKSMSTFKDLFESLIKLTQEIMNVYFSTLGNGVLQSEGKISVKTEDI